MTTISERIVECAQNLGHMFQRPELLREALTHRSYANEHPDTALRDNERLEFLGDAVLSVVVARLLWDHFPEAPEGELTRRRADLVSERGLTEVAKKLDLGQFLLLGKGEENSGGREKSRLLSSALEACLAAIYLDASIEEAMRCGQAWFRPHLHKDTPGRYDYKSRAQEAAQRKGGSAPSYELLRADGPDHDKTFFVLMRIDDQIVSDGSGKSKNEAEQNAAQKALEQELIGD